MQAYKCKQCGIITPIIDRSGNQLPPDRKCFRCGCKEKEKVQLPNFPVSKKYKRQRFSNGRGRIIRFNISAG